MNYSIFVSNSRRKPLGTVFPSSYFGIDYYFHYIMIWFHYYIYCDMLRYFQAILSKISHLKWIFPIWSETAILIDVFLRYQTNIFLRSEVNLSTEANFIAIWSVCIAIWSWVFQIWSEFYSYMNRNPLSEANVSIWSEFLLRYEAILNEFRYLKRSFRFEANF